MFTIEDVKRKACVDLNPGLLCGETFVNNIGLTRHIGLQHTRAGKKAAEHTLRLC